MSTTKSYRWQRFTQAMISGVLCFVTLATIAWFISKETELAVRLSPVFAIASAIIAAIASPWRKIRGLYAVVFGVVGGAISAIVITALASQSI